MSSENDTPTPKAADTVVMGMDGSPNAMYALECKYLVLKFRGNWLKQMCVRQFLTLLFSINTDEIFHNKQTHIRFNRIYPLPFVALCIVRHFCKYRRITKPFCYTYM